MAGDFQPQISAAAARHGLPAALVRAVVAVESGGEPRAVSPKGALGLMQLMPATARELGVSDPLDPWQNLEGGCRYLRQQLDRFGDLRLALAAYNAGPEAVEMASGVPAITETREYVARILAQLTGMEPPVPAMAASDRATTVRRQEGRVRLSIPSVEGSLAVEFEEGSDATAMGEDL